ncbi:LPS export ABC transporter permease LptF [Gammaproteobacteria bacterium]|nr:LPS export ABC transporter permease LptF [Gammaproteobacteria bacterium]
MLIRRYLALEVAYTLLATLLVLLGIIFVQRLAMYLSQAASGLLSQNAILSLLGLQMLRFATELLPLSFFIAALMTFGRLYRDSEMSAMFALGISINDLYKSLLIISIPISIVLMGLNFYVIPKNIQFQYELQTKARKDAQLNIFKAGVFRELMGGRHVIYVGKIADNGTELVDVFVKSLDEAGKISITTAKTGRQSIDVDTGIRFLHLFDGGRYEIEHDLDKDKDKEIMVTFKSMRLKIDQTPPLKSSNTDARSTKDLIKNYTHNSAAELQKRLSGPLSLFILVLMIPSLAHSKPRDGRYNRLILGVIIYVVYFNLLKIGEAWLHKEMIPMILGLWWVHLVMLSLGLYMRYKRNNLLS